MNYLAERNPVAEREKAVGVILESNKGWKDKYKTLVGYLEGEDPSKKARAQVTLQVMDNQQRMMEAVCQDPKMEATFTAALGALVPRVVDLVRIFYPNLVINELMDIQPIDRQNGEIFVIKPKFTHTDSGVTAGQEVFKNLTDGHYAFEEKADTFTQTADGMVVTFTGTANFTPVRPGTVRVVSGSVVGTDDGAGNITGAGIAAGTIDYATGAISVTYSVAPTAGANQPTWTYRFNYESNSDGIRELEIDLALIPIQAKAHPLRVKWSTQAQLAASAHLNLDIPDTLANLVASFIQNERDILGINQIVANATADPNLDFNATASANYSKIAKYAEIELKLNYAESAIQTAQGRGGVSWILAGSNAADIWRNVNGFVPSGVVAPVGPHKVGMLRDGTVSVIKVPSLNANTYVVGFKGYVVGDSASILAEWVPLYASPVFNSHDLNNYQGMMSLYDIFVNNAGYYRKGQISSYTA